MTSQITPEPEETAAIISKINHDVRNSVRAFIEVPKWIKYDLKSHGIDLPDDVLEHFDLLAVHAHRLDRMVQDCTTFLRAGMATGAHVHDLSGCLSELVAGLEIPDGFTVTYDVQTKGVFIPKADLMTLLSELLTNGIKHHDRADGRLHIRAVTDGGGCRILVSDDGPGIAQSDADRVFKMMTTLRPRDEVEGSGMGLAVVLKIVTSYGGSLQMSAGPSATGSTFEVWFPELIEL